MMTLLTASIILSCEMIPEGERNVSVALHCWSEMPCDEIVIETSMGRYRAEATVHPADSDSLYALLETKLFEGDWVIEGRAYASGILVAEGRIPGTGTLPFSSGQTAELLLNMYGL